MNPDFNRVAIIGVGLIGGSLGMALCARGLAAEVVGAGSRMENLLLAREMGAIHSFVNTPQEGVAGADLVILATPVRAALSVLKNIMSFLKPGAIVTDVGSTKASIVREAEDILPEGVNFIGGHPMAGSDQAGVRGADPYLFENAFYIVTPTKRTSPEALLSVKKMATGVGARVLEMDPDHHDLAVAAVSHLPHLLASALVNTVTRMPGSDRVLPLAAGGFRDTTRIAAGSPVMWRDIFYDNREQLLNMVNLFRLELDLFESSIMRGELDSIENNLESARQARSGLPDRTKGYLPCLFEIVVTVPDRPGVIAGFTAHLARAGINISDIEILRVREGEGGTIKIGFASGEEQDLALQVLRENGYAARKR